MFQSNGFYGHVQRNNFRSLTMFIGFVFAFQLVGAIVLFIPLLFLDADHWPIYNFHGYLERYAPALMIIGSGYFIFRYLRHVKSVRSKLGFRLVDRHTHPRLVNIVEVQALGAGLPLPRTGIIESRACNAFACGLSPESAVVVATSGLVDALDDDELAAVMAHEIAHIKNGDIRLMAAANVLMENLEALGRLNFLRITGWKSALLAVFFFPFLILALLGGLLVTVAFTIARISRLLISSSRELIADAEAVRITHNPAALISALRRIEGRSAIEGLVPGTDAMMIDGAVEGAFATHPTISERVAVLTRLSGPMAYASGPRRDTRPNAPQPLLPRAIFGLRNATISSTTTNPSSSLIGRVNAGTGNNIFGFGRKITIFLAVSIVAFTVLQMHWASKARDAFARVTVLSPSLSPEVGGNATSSARRRAQQILQELAATDPISARCFATERYQVGDRGLHELTKPDPMMVEMFATGARRSTDVDLERYLGQRLNSVRAVATAEGSEIDNALIGYVSERKSLLEILHRFFDEPGLRLMQDTYDSDEDRAVLDRLRSRLDDRAPLLIADSRSVAEMTFLLTAPEAFIPCVARLASDNAG